MPSFIFLFAQWIKPFNYDKGLQMLCTDNNHFEVMRGRESPLVTFFKYVTNIICIFGVLQIFNFSQF